MVMVGGSTKTLSKIFPQWDGPPEGMLDLLGELYETLLREDRWPEVLAHMADLFDAADASFIEWEQDYSAVRYFVSAGRCHTPESESLFKNHYALLDPALAVGREAPAGSAGNCVDMFKPDFVERNEYYRDFLLPRDMRYRVASKMRGAPDNAAFLFLYRRADQGPFGVEHMRLLSYLDSHLRRLAQLHGELNKLRSEKREAIDMLDQQPTAFVTANRDAKARTLNGPAGKLLLARDGLFLTNGILDANQPGVARNLRLMVGMACGPAPTPPSGAIWLPRSNGKRALICIVSPGKPAADRPAYAILSIADPLSAPPITGRHLTELYGLTSAEARLACDMTEGKSVEAIAAERRVAVSTVRSQLSSTLHKCGVERQVDLVRLLCRLPSSGRLA